MSSEAVLRGTANEGVGVWYVIQVQPSIPIAFKDREKGRQDFSLCFLT